MRNNNHPLVSILMPTYNRSKFIESAIESVFNSSFTDWELIIVDDCSTDNTVQLVKKYLYDKRVFFYQNKHNLRQFQNRNKTASFAKGKYLKFIDSDDLIYKYSLAVFVEAMEENQNAVFAFQHYKRDDYKPYPILLGPREAFQEHFLSPYGLFNCGPSGTIFRRDKFLESKGYLEDDYVGNDTELLIRLATNNPCLKIQPSLVWWRQHPEQAFQHGHKTNEYVLKEFFVQEKFLLSHNCPLLLDERRKALNFLKWKFSRKILLIIKHQTNFKLALTTKKRLKLNTIDILKGLFPFKL